MSRAHIESRTCAASRPLLDEIDPVAPEPDDLVELRRVLYGLYAILQLHFSQEDEGYLSLVDDHRPARSPASPTERARS
jgi:hypothetical protein